MFTVQTLPANDKTNDDRVGKMAGFSLHAGVAAGAEERDKLERLCRYISRPAVSEKRLSLTSSGQIRYRLKTPYRDGTTHVIFERGGLPYLDFIARLAALAWPAASQTESEPDAISWCIRFKQQAPCADHAIEAGQGQEVVGYRRRRT